MSVCPDVLFQDITTFDTGKGFCVLRSKACLLPPVQIVHVGFSCKDVSSLNKHSKSARYCIRKSSLRTGGTFAGAVAFVSQLRPVLVLLENVAALDRCDTRTGVSSAHDVRDIFAELGYILCDSVCNAMFHGVPHRRTRWWAVAVQVSASPVTDEDVIAHREAIGDFHNALDLLRVAPVPLDSILMCEGSEELGLWQADRLREAARSQGEEGDDELSRVEQEAEGQLGKEKDTDKAAGRAKRPNWPELHAEHFRTQDLRYPPVYSLLYSTEEQARLRVLPLWAREIVYYFDSLLGRATVEEVIEVSQSICRVPRMTAGLPCCTPRNLLWLRKRFRLVQANEALQAQGVRLRTRSEVAGFSGAELSSLAGSAFSAYTSQVVSIAALASFRVFKPLF